MQTEEVIDLTEIIEVGVTQIDKQRMASPEVRRDVRIQSCYNVLSKMSSFQQKHYETRKKQKSVIHTQGEKRRKYKLPLRGTRCQTKHFEEYSINKCKELKKTMPKEVKEGAVAMSHQRVSIKR